MKQLWVHQQFAPGIAPTSPRIASDSQRAPHVEIEIVKVADDPAHLAGAKLAVVIDHDRSLARRARHRPRLRPLQALLVEIEVEPQIAPVVQGGRLPHSRRQVREQPFA